MVAGILPINEVYLRGGPPLRFETCRLRALDPRRVNIRSDNACQLHFAGF